MAVNYYEEIMKDYKIELNSDKSIFNKNNTAWETGKYPLFLGDSMALLDSIATNYPKLFDLYKLQKSMDWNEDEVNLQQSRQDLLNTTKNNYDIMVKTLAFQWELDSTASRAIAPLFSPFISNSELWMAYSKISEMECVAEGTEVLTENGWKDISEIKVGDMVYQFNPDNKHNELVEVSNTIKKPYKGKMIQFKDDSTDRIGTFNQLVTPNHRMIAYDFMDDEGERPFIEVLSKDMEYNDYILGVVTGTDTSNDHLISFNFTVTKVSHKEEVPYDGIVYCITVPSGYFVMRYEGAVSVTGNCLHSLTYSEIIRQCVNDPQEVYKEVMHSDEVLNRSVAVIEAFNVLDTYGAKYKLGMVERDDRDMHYAVLKALIALLCLEGIEFMASFACTFALAEQNIFMGIAKLVQKIMLDENVHVMVGKEVLGILLHNEKNIWTELFEENKEDLTNMVVEVINQELSWNEYIFSEGRSIVGLNKILLDEWVLWKSQEIMEFLRMDNPFDKIKTNPLRWMDNWEDLNKKQNANQETDNTNYRLNAVTDDSEDAVFEL